MKKSAFTLIELLVVVAVIAILAAIAVPNFLEAMTRAKVSRAKTDMRTVSVALESYRVDLNKYPPDYQFGAITFLERLDNLTTPIAYITSVPPDPLADRGRIDEHSQPKPSNPHREGGGKTAPWNPVLTYDYAYRFQPNGQTEALASWAKISGTPGAVLWALSSAGPDLWPAYLSESGLPYDPTNGTVSDGNILWTGPGRGEDVPLDLTP